MKPSKPRNSSTAPLSPPEPAPALAEFQRVMAAAIMRPLTADERSQPASEDNEAAVRLVKPNDRLTAFERLEIYNRQYWFRLLECLHEDYPGLRAILGDARFQRLTVAYLERHPSTSPALRDLGQNLAAFIHEQPEFARPHEIIASEMARVEWAQVVAFDGASLPVDNLVRLAGKSPDAIFFRLQPYITLLDLTYPMDEALVRVLRRNGNLRSEASNAVISLTKTTGRSIARRIAPRQTRLLVHRFENTVYFKRLEPAQYALLSSLAAGKSLAVALDNLKRVPSPENIQTWFQNWAHLGFLAPGRPPTRSSARGSRAISRRSQS